MLALLSNATKGEHFLGSSVNSIIELSILITEEHADSFINPLPLLTSLLITSQISISLIFPILLSNTDQYSCQQLLQLLLVFLWQELFHHQHHLLDLSR